MGKGDVNLKIGAESTEAVKSVQEFQKSVAKSLGEIEKNFGVIKTAAVAAFAVFAGKEVIGFLKDGFDAAIKQEDAMARLGHQMKLTGDFSDGALSHFKDFADQMERTTKYGDDVILSQLAIAKSFGASNQEAEDLVKAATELSAAYGIDLDTTVKELGQSLSGTSGKLAKQIPEVKDLTDAQLAHGEAIKIVLDRYGGSATSELNTFGGALTHLAAAWDNVKEAIATVITSSPVVVEAIKATTEVINKLEDSINDSSGGLTSFIQNGILYLTASLGVATEGFGYFVGAVRVAVVPVEALGKAIVKVNQYMDDWKQRLTQPAFGLFSDHITTTGDILNEEYSKAVENTNAQLDSMGESTAKAALFFDDLGNRLAASASKDRVATNTYVDSSQRRTRVLESEKKAAEEAQKSYEEYLAMLAEEGRKAFNALHDIPESLIHDIDNQIAEIPKKIADATAAAAANPAKFAVEMTVEKLGIKPIELTKFQSEMAGAAVGLIGSMLEGAAGAKSLIANGAGAIANALIPGIGSAVSGIIGKLAEGPDATKKAIKEWIAAIPEIMEAVAAASDVVVITFVETMVNKGGAVRIGIAIAKATATQIAQEGIWKGLGRQWGIDVGRGFNAENIGHTMAHAFGQGSDRFHAAMGSLSSAGKEFGHEIHSAFTQSIAALHEFNQNFYKIVDSIKNAGRAFGLSISNAFKHAIDAFHTFPRAFNESVTHFQNVGHQLGIDFRNFILHAPENIASGFRTGVKLLHDAISRMVAFGHDLPGMIADGFHAGIDALNVALAGMTNVLNQFGAALAETVKKAAEDIKKAIYEGAVSLETAVFDALKKVGDPIVETLKEGIKNLALPAITIPTPPWVDKLIEALNSFQFPGASVGGGKGGGLVQTVVNAVVPTPHAKGGLIPQGFPNDSYLAGLTSGELVIPRDDVTQLRSFLNSQNGATSGETNGAMLALLAQILAALNRGTTIQTDLKIDSQSLGKAILNLSRNNARLSA